MDRDLITRSATQAVDSPNSSPKSSSTPGRWTNTRTSKRSKNGPLKRRRYFVNATSSHSHEPGAPPPQGHGFVAPTSVKRAGRVRRVCARETRMTPSSRGWRRASRTEGANSPSSSKNNTPPWAMLTSPGRNEDDPPPTMETALAP